MRATRIVFSAVFAILASVAARDPVSAHSSIDRGATNDLEAMVEGADLIFIGRVSVVHYRMSEGRSDDEIALPHAIVTYRIDNVLRGQAPDKAFTMRFIGGPDGRGRFLEVSGVPRFQHGEHDLLFVAGNGEEGCPLLLCEWGRYRILRGGVYNTKGAPVRALDKGRSVARGMPPKEFRSFHYPAPNFDDLLKNVEVQEVLRKSGMTAAEARRRYATEAPKQIEVSTEVSTRGREEDAARADQRDVGRSARSGEHAIALTPEGIPEGPMAIEEFVSAVKTIIQHAKRKPKPLRSVDPNAPISVKRGQPLRAQEAEAPRPGAAPQTPEEAAELEALRKQDFDPVLKDKKD